MFSCDKTKGDAPINSFVYDTQSKPDVISTMNDSSNCTAYSFRQMLAVFSFLFHARFLFFIYLATTELA